MMKDTAKRVLLACALLSACDPALRVAGTIVDRDGRAVPGADIVYECPERPGRVAHARSGSYGEFVVPVDIGCVYAGCTLSVSVPNGKSVTAKAMDSCVEKRLACSKGCSHVEARIVAP